MLSFLNLKKNKITFISESIAAAKSNHNQILKIFLVKHYMIIYTLNSKILKSNYHSKHAASGKLAFAAKFIQKNVYYRELLLLDKMSFEMSKFVSKVLRLRLD